VTFASPCVTEIPSIVLEGEIDPGAVMPPRVRRVLELCAIDGVELHQSVTAARPAAVATPRGGPPLNPSTSNK
jgi:hypothetical protein